MGWLYENGITLNAHAHRPASVADATQHIHVMDLAGIAASALIIDFG